MKFIHRIVVAVLLVACCAAVAVAQAPKPAVRVGWLAVGRAQNRVFLDAFKAGLRERGWSEGKNLVIEERWGTRASSQDLAAELTRANVDVLVTQGPMAFGAQAAAAGKTPVVFGFSGDPVEGKLVTSLAHPGG